MSLEFTIIRNPRNLLFKNEVWIKGEALHNDSLGQPVNRQKFCQKGPSFVTIKGAESFIAYERESRHFRGAV
jgi:hypothetical protein